MVLSQNNESPHINIFINGNKLKQRDWFKKQFIHFYHHKKSPGVLYWAHPDVRSGQFQNNWKKTRGNRNVVSTENAMNLMDCKEIKRVSAKIKLTKQDPS